MQQYWLFVTLPMFGKRYISWQHLGFTPCASHNASTAPEGAAFLLTLRGLQQKAAGADFCPCSPVAQ
jgi:hypothetical protein